MKSAFFVTMKYSGEIYLPNTKLLKAWAQKPLRENLVTMEIV